MRKPETASISVIIPAYKMGAARSEFGGLMSEIRDQRPETGDQRTEDRGQRRRGKGSWNDDSPAC